MNCLASRILMQAQEYEVVDQSTLQIYVLLHPYMRWEHSGTSTNFWFSNLQKVIQQLLYVTDLC